MPDRRFEDSERRFRLLVDSVTDHAISMLDPQGRVMTWNPGARRIQGYEAEEIVGRHFDQFFSEEDRSADLPRRVLETAAQEGVYQSEGWRVRKDGERFWANVVVNPIWSADGTLAGFAEVVRDETRKRQAEIALYESEQRFRMLVEGVSDYAIYMLDTEGRITNWNSGAQAIKGYTADEIVGQHFSIFYTEEDRARKEPARTLQTVLEEGRFETEAWRVRKDGTRFFAHVVVDPIYDQSGRHAGYAKITRDITEKRQSQLELEEARAALFQAQKLQALGELTGGIAHDFNNLMTVIRGSADLLRRGDLPRERRERYLDAIIETADRAATLTSHLLAFGRRQALKPEVLDLNLRMDAFSEVLSRTLGSRIEIVVDLAPSLWAVEVDPTQLETALLNAAINARDAMPDGGQLTLSTRNETAEGGDMVRVSVADTGTGMPADVVSRAFDPFFTTKPVGKGTGLGLSQIHGFAAQTGGQAEILSVEGEGTTISILLPRSLKAVHGEGAQGEACAIPPGLVVLLVEDNDQVRDFAADLLEDLDCRVLRASDASQALSLLAAEKVDLVFSDVVMPGMGGIDLAREIRRLYPALPVLLASGYSEDIMRGAASEFEFVQKPYGADTLSIAIASQLRGPPKRGQSASAQAAC